LKTATTVPISGGLYFCGGNLTTVDPNLTPCPQASIDKCAAPASGTTTGTTSGTTSGTTTGNAPKAPFTNNFPKSEFYFRRRNGD
jgi:hypothetical protein